MRIMIAETSLNGDRWRLTTEGGRSTDGWRVLTLERLRKSHNRRRRPRRLWRMGCNGERLANGEARKHLARNRADVLAWLEAQAITAPV